VAHRNARLTVHGRALLVDRVLRQGRPRAHVAAEMGMSRQCASRWINRYLAEGEPGLRDRFSRVPVEVPILRHRPIWDSTPTTSRLCTPARRWSG
jgi:transposase